MAAYLTKPVSQSELYEGIAGVLVRPGARAETAPLITRHSLREKLRKCHILVAEDNLVNQRLVVGLLERRGYDVQVVASGRQALTLTEKQKFDIVLMDVQMPEMDGLEATAAIRAQGQAAGGHVPIIAMTAHAMKGDQGRCLAAGMDDYVSKPVHPQELYEAIDRLQGSSLIE